MSYDTQCLTLAQAFLRDYDYLTDEERAAHAAKMAQDIQDAIETYLSVEKMDEREDARAEAT